MPSPHVSGAMASLYRERPRTARRNRAGTCGGAEMTTETIRGAIGAASAYLTEHPDEAAYTDSAATASLEDGLRVNVVGPAGESVTTDMPASVGGAASAPSAGWLLR